MKVIGILKIPEFTEQNIQIIETVIEINPEESVESAINRCFKSDAGSVGWHYQCEFVLKLIKEDK